MQQWFNEIKEKFILNFIDDNRWQYLLEGLGVTLEVTFFALILGVVIGSVVSIIRSTYDKNKDGLYGVGKVFLTIANGFCKFYLTIIRGTPVVVQMLIGYFVIFASSRNTVLVASLVFGINSGAYVTEIFRSGIMSIDEGQFEAGHSLGLNYTKTMLYIIVPQAFKNVLPTLANEFIVLLKETAVCGYIGLMDLTKAGDIIRGRTFSPFMPLFAVALVYLALVMVLTWLVGILERRLRSSDR